MPQPPARHETTRDQNMNASDRPQQPAAAELEATRLRGLSEAERTLLVVDDDAPLCQRLARAMERRGFVVSTADSVATGTAAATAQPPAFAVVDLRLGDGSGLDVVSALRAARPAARIVVLTGYGNIATAVAAVKAGALDYLPKPADADAVERALLAQEGETPAPPEDPMSADRVRWEHIQRIFELCDRNVSETARRLKMHRRTLQRILSKHAPRS
jgi:two-component system response regulator RegA